MLMSSLSAYLIGLRRIMCLFTLSSWACPKFFKFVEKLVVNVAYLRAYADGLSPYV